jgi:hypothetical protein
MTDNAKLFKIVRRYTLSLLLLGTCFLGGRLFAQTTDATGDSTSAAAKSGDKNDKENAKKDKPEQTNPREGTGKREKVTGKSNPEPVAAGLAVDSARKSNDLPVSWSQTDANEGAMHGDYEVRQSAEFGGRVSNFAGNAGTWDTFVNLGTGPRLLEYTLSVHSPTHNGAVFDDLTFTNFGYGGDPNNLSRIQILKGTLYNFNTNFRRDQNIFDYDLLANPLNPTPSNPIVPILNSPHEFLITRRMSDANLTLLPLGRVRYRLGWSRVVNEGTAFSSFHQGTEAELAQPTLNTTDNFYGGISLRVIPRTSLNYDQFYTHFKGDTSATLSNFGLPSFTLAGGIPVNLGTSFNTPAGQPCAAPILGTGFVNPACNAFFSLNRTNDKTRNSFPTEQFSFQSNYWRRLDLSGRINYSDDRSNLPAFNQVFTGLESRTRAVNQAETGNALTRRFSLGADFGMTFRLTDKLRLVDAFRFDNFRLPGTYSLATNTLFAPTLLSTPNAFNPATCPPPFTAATCPQHSAGSGPDIIQDNFVELLRQDEKINTVELEYDLTRRITGHVGWRYEDRQITDNQTDIQLQTIFPTQAIARGCPTAAGCTLTVPDINNAFVPIIAHSGLAGFSMRLRDDLRLNFDTEFYSGDNTFTRISPRHFQIYKLRAQYHPKGWFSFGSAMNILEKRNPGGDIGNFQHNRSYAFNGTVAPPDGRWGVDLSYEYNDIFSQTNICFVATPTTPGTTSCGAPFLSGLSVYSELAHNGSVSLYAKPVRRVSAGIGYTVTSTTGNTLILNPNAPTGPLSYNYHLPLATLAIELSKNLTYKTGWNYYDYHEKSNPGPTLPRDFRGNVFTLSLRYAM